MSTATIPQKRPPSNSVSKMASAAKKSNASTSSAAPPSAFQGMFEGFRAELDEHQDRRERIIKANRDITASSKKWYMLPSHATDLSM